VVPCGEPDAGIVVVHDLHDRVGKAGALERGHAVGAIQDDVPRIANRLGRGHDRRVLEDPGILEPCRERARPPVVLLLVRHELLDRKEPQAWKAERRWIAEGHGSGA